MKKKIISVIITIILVVPLGLINMGAASNNDVVQNYVNSFAQGWINKMYSGNAQIGDIVGVYDANNTITGYSVSFTNNDQPDGYIILSTNTRDYSNPIMQFSLSGKDVYDSLQGTIPAGNGIIINRTATQQLPRHLYNSSPFEYGIDVSTNNGSYIFDTDESLISKDTYEKSRNTSTSNIPFDKAFIHNSLPSGTPVSSSTYTITGAANFIPLLMSDMPSWYGDGKTAGADSEGNCGPTCLTNICYFFSYERSVSNLLKNNKISDTYNALSYNCAYTPAGGTLDSELVPALKDYTFAREINCSISSDLQNNWTAYTQHLNWSNQPIMMSVHGYSSATSSTIDGHDIIAVGYMRMTDNSTYLRIINEWDPNTNEYVRFDLGYGLTSTDGYAVSMS